MIAEPKAKIVEDACVVKPYILSKMIVAHDASESSDKALDDAVLLARRFDAEVILAHVQSPTDPGASDESGALRHARREAVSDVEALAYRLASGGLRSRGVVRAGSVGDTLFNLCCEEQADLLLMGAYGHGSRDRQTLGSTAEQLLRAVPCPVLTYGPNTCSAVISAQHLGPILLPIAVPCSETDLSEAVALAKMFGEPVELFHAVDGILHRDIKWLERECQAAAAFFRQNNVRTQWSFTYGQPDRCIRSRSHDIDSPFILMPLKWRKGLSAETSDNVAAHVIRQLAVPVLSYRCA